MATKRKPKVENNQESKPDNSVKIAAIPAVISTAGVVMVAFITYVFGPAVLKSMDKTHGQAAITQSTSTTSFAQDKYFEDFTKGSEYLKTDCQQSEYEIYWTAICSIVNDAFRWQLVGKTNSTAGIPSTLPPLSDFDLEVTFKLVNFSPSGWSTISRE
jgi:maltose-binding protein MalE